MVGRKEIGVLEPRATRRDFIVLRMAWEIHIRLLVLGLHIQ